MQEQLPSFLSGIIEAVADPIFVKDEQHRWILLNEATCRFMGHPREALIGKSDFDFFPKEEAETFWEIDDEVFRTGKTIENVERFTGANGRTRIISTKKSIYLNDQGEKVLVGVIRDLTKFKAIEDELRLARDLAQKADLAKSQFVANASHELRTPLNGIVGIVDLLLDHSWQPEIKELLDVLRDSAGNLLNLVNDVLDFSSIESGKLEIKPLNFSPRQLLKTIATLFDPQLREKSLDLRVEVDASVPEELYADPHRIRQVLVNLISNSVKFTHQEGRIAVKLFQETDSKQQYRLTIQVSDDGIGIPTDKLENVFLPFSKARNEDKGTGLGLSISQRLAQLLQGELSLESNGERGCVAVFTLPVMPKQTQTGEIDDPTSLKGVQFPNLRVLVVEDDPVSQRVALHTLKRLKCSPSVAQNGLEALKMTETQAFDLVLMDCRMPHLDGYEASREMRKRGISVPIVALTAHAFEEDREKCLAAGMTDWLTKPLLRKDLIAVLSRLAP